MRKSEREREIQSEREREVVIGGKRVRYLLWINSRLARLSSLVAAGNICSCDRIEQDTTRCDRQRQAGYTCKVRKSERLLTNLNHFNGLHGLNSKPN